MRKKLLVIAALLSIAQPTVAGNTKKLDIPYLRPGMDVGGGSATLILDATLDKRVNTCAIVAAVTKLPAGFNSLPPEGMTPMQKYVTDYQVVTPELLASYGQSVRNLPLAPGPIYAVTYEITYQVLDDVLRYQVTATMYYRGASSTKWYALRQGYDDGFFSQRLLGMIGSEIRSCIQRAS